MPQLSAPSTLSSVELIINTKTVMKTQLPTDVLDHVCVCASASRDNKGCLSKARAGTEDVGGWTREDWASAVRAVLSHMAQRPRSTMLNDKEPSLSPLHHGRTHLYTHLCLQIYSHAHVHTHTQTKTPPPTHTHTKNFCMHLQICMTQPHQPYRHTKTCTRHIHRQAYSSPAFCIGDTFHYSKLLSGDVVRTSWGDMHSLQTRYSLIMHAQTTGIAFWCVCVSVYVCFVLTYLIVSVYTVRGTCACVLCESVFSIPLCVCAHMSLCRYLAPFCVHLYIFFLVLAGPQVPRCICDRAHFEIQHYLEQATISSEQSVQ